jgi:CBS domain containing-hemolysin-like protein
MIDIVDALREYAEVTAQASKRCLNEQGQDRIATMAGLILDAADLIVQLRERLVRQACHLEVIEAEVQRPRWPLLEDDDDPGMGL